MSSELTVVERPGWATTSPASASRSSASRTGVRLTPSHVGELDVAQLLAGGERAVDDGVAQAAVDVVAEQPAVDRGHVLGNRHATY